MTPTRALMMLFALAAACPSLAQPAALEGIAREGRLELREGRYDRARDLFSRGIEMARQEGEDEWLARFHFYRGNANLVEARKTGRGERARRAARDYRAVLEMRPASGSAMVNLAGALGQLGKDDDARRWYERAIALDDEKQGLYRKQYAAFLEPRDADAAAEQLRLLLAEQPNSAQAKKALVRTYREPRNAERLAGYLMEQVARGEVLSAQETALEALDDPRWSTEQKYPLMQVIGASLAAQFVDAGRFAESDTAAALRRAGERDPGLRVCVDELLRTVDPAIERVDYAWWTADREREKTLSTLLRSLARSHHQSGEAPRAETLYREAVELDGGDDPRAVLDLVQFYAESGDIDGINRVSQQYEYQLFEGKGRAYRAGDVVAIYDFHRTLAAIYANQAERTGDWGTTMQSNTAAFQLEHAYRTAMRAGDITPDAQLVDHLARSYEAAGDPARAVSLRLDAASSFQLAGNNVAAGRVLAPVRALDLSTAERARYERLTRDKPVRPQVYGEQERVDRERPVVPNVPD